MSKLSNCHLCGNVVHQPMYASAPRRDSVVVCSQKCKKELEQGWLQGDYKKPFYSNSFIKLFLVLALVVYGLFSAGVEEISSLFGNNSKDNFYENLERVKEERESNEYINEDDSYSEEDESDNASNFNPINTEMSQDYEEPSNQNANQWESYEEPNDNFTFSLPFSLKQTELSYVDKQKFNSDASYNRYPAYKFHGDYENDFRVIFRTFRDSKSLTKRYKKLKDKTTSYDKLSSSYFVVSGVKNGDIYYYKERFKNGKTYAVYFDYPENSTETQKYNKWCEKILSEFEIN